MYVCLLSKTAVRETLTGGDVRDVVPHQPAEMTSVLLGGVSPFGVYARFIPVTGNTLDNVTPGATSRNRWTAFLAAAKPALQQRLALFESFFAALAATGLTTCPVAIPANVVRSSLLLLCLSQLCVHMALDSDEAVVLVPTTVQLGNMLGLPNVAKPATPRTLWVADWTKDDETVATNVCVSMVIVCVSVSLITHRRPLWPIPRGVFVAVVLGQDFMHGNQAMEQFMQKRLASHAAAFSFKGMLSADFRAVLQLWFLTGQVLDFKIMTETGSVHPDLAASEEAVLYRQSNERIADIYRSQLWDIFPSLSPTIAASAQLVERVYAAESVDAALAAMKRAFQDASLKTRFVIPDMAHLISWHASFLVLEYKVGFMQDEPFTTDLDSFRSHFSSLVALFKCLWVLLFDTTAEKPSMPLRFMMSRETVRFLLFATTVIAASQLVVLLEAVNGVAMVEWLDDAESAETKEAFVVSSGRIPDVCVNVSQHEPSYGAIMAAAKDVNVMLRVMELGASWGVVRMRASRDYVEAMLAAAKGLPFPEIGAAWRSLSLR